MLKVLKIHQKKVDTPIVTRKKLTPRVTSETRSLTFSSGIDREYKDLRHFAALLAEFANFCEILVILTRRDGAEGEARSGVPEC